MTELADADRSAATGVPVSLEVSFEAFYTSEYRSVFGLAYALSGSRSAADDIAQEAFLAAYRNWSRISSYHDAGAWVRRACVNRSISIARRKLTEARALVRLSARRPPSAENALPDEALWRAVRRLPKRQAQVIALRAFSGLDISSIATVLGLSEATVKTHLQRARQRLASTLEGTTDDRS